MRNVVRFTLIAAAAAILSTVGFAQAAKIDLSGTWGFSVETGAGPGTPTIILKQDTDKLTGHYSGQLGEADLTGSVKGQDFTFVFTVVAQGMPLKCTYAGHVESKDALKGTVDISGLANGTFTAARR